MSLGGGAHDGASVDGVPGWGRATGRSYHDPDGPLHHAGDPPGGRGEGRGGPVDVRRHRAALRPGEPDHDVPHGRRLAPQDRARASGCRRRPRSSTWRAAPATCAASWRRAGSDPIGVDLSFGMLAAARTDAPLVHGDALRLPFPDGSVSGVTCGFALRNFASLPPFFAELARVVRPGRPGRAARGGRAAEPAAAGRARLLLRQGRAPRRRPALRPGRLPVPAALGRLPARARRDARPARARPGFDGVDRRLLSVGIAQLITGTRSAVGVTELVATHPARRPGPRPARAGRARRRAPRARPHRPGRAGVAARVPLARGRRAPRRHRARRRGRRARHRTGGLRRAPLPRRARPPSWWSPRWCGVGPTTAPAGSPRSRPPGAADPTSAVAAAEPPARSRRR